MVISSISNLLTCGSISIGTHIEIFTKLSDFSAAVVGILS